MTQAKTEPTLDPSLTFIGYPMVENFGACKVPIRQPCAPDELINTSEILAIGKLHFGDGHPNIVLMKKDGRILRVYGHEQPKETANWLRRLSSLQYSQIPWECLYRYEWTRFSDGEISKGIVLIWDGRKYCRPKANIDQP